MTRANGGRGEEVAGAHHHERRGVDLAQAVGGVVVEDADQGALERLVVGALDGGPHLLDGGRRGALAERRADEEQRQVVAGEAVARARAGPSRAGRRWSRPGPRPGARGPGGRAGPRRWPPGRGPPPAPGAPRGARGRRRAWPCPPWSGPRPGRRAGPAWSGRWPRRGPGCPCRSRRRRRRERPWPRRSTASTRWSVARSCSWGDHSSALRVIPWSSTTGRPSPRSRTWSEPPSWVGTVRWRTSGGGTSRRSVAGSVRDRSRRASTRSVATPPATRAPRPRILRVEGRTAVILADRRRRRGGSGDRGRR